MVNIRLILMIIAFVLFALRGFGLTHPRFDLVAIGLALWVLAVILT
jgi:hypothetical protein